ncbi:MAG: hypothetical protein WCY76_06655, partial [Leucobacter sp.]
MTKNTNEPQDHIPTTPLAGEDLAAAAQTPKYGAETTAEATADTAAGASPLGPENPQADPASSSVNSEAAESPTDRGARPFFKRKWVLITAPIVAGVLLLGIGGSVGYAIGDDDRGGRHMSDGGRQFGDRDGGGPRGDGFGRGGGFDRGHGGPGADMGFTTPGAP